MTYFYHVFFLDVVTVRRTFVAFLDSPISVHRTGETASRVHDNDRSTREHDSDGRA